MGDPTLFLNVVLCLFWQHQFGSIRAKIPVGDVSWGLLGKIGHFRQGRTRAYEHRLGPINSVCELCKNQPYSPLPLGKAYKVIGITF